VETRGRRAIKVQTRTNLVEEHGRDTFESKDLRVCRDSSRKKIEATKLTIKTVESARSEKKRSVRIIKDMQKRGLKEALPDKLRETSGMPQGTTETRARQQTVSNFQRGKHTGISGTHLKGPGLAADINSRVRKNLRGNSVA